MLTYAFFAGSWKNSESKFWWWKHSMGRAKTLQIRVEVRRITFDKTSQNNIYLRALMKMHYCNCHWLKCVFFSEIRLVEILDGACYSSSFECNHMMEENEEHFETWWFKRSGTQMENLCHNSWRLHSQGWGILRVVTSRALLSRQAFLSALHLICLHYSCFVMLQLLCQV